MTSVGGTSIDRKITLEDGVNPLSVHQVGDRVRVVVTAIDPEKERTLSIEQLAADPWTRVGSAFVDGGPTKRGSRRSWLLGRSRVSVTVGDHVRVKIVGIESERRRLSFWIRQAEERNSPNPNV